VETTDTTIPIAVAPDVIIEPTSAVTPEPTPAPTPVAKSTSETAGDEQPSSARRGRGRPRKADAASKTPATVIEAAVETLPSDIKEVTAEVGLKVSDAPKKPARRGRKPKAEVQSETPATEPMTKPVTEATAESAPKAPAEETGATSKAAADLEPSTDDSLPTDISGQPKRSRGRGRRHASKIAESGPGLSVSDLKAQLMEDGTEPAKIDSAEPEKAKRRGRGRPRKDVGSDPAPTTSPANTAESE
jgi:hypothetical protein